MSRNKSTLSGSLELWRLIKWLFFETLYYTIVLPGIGNEHFCFSAGLCIRNRQKQRRSMFVCVGCLCRGGCLWGCHLSIAMQSSHWFVSVWYCNSFTQSNHRADADGWNVCWCLLWTQWSWWCNNSRNGQFTYHFFVCECVINYCIIAAVTVLTRVAQRVERWTCNQQVVSSIPTRGRSLHLGQVVHTYVPLSPSSVTWYRPEGSDALRLGR